MNEAIFILEREKKLLENCLKGFNKEEYQEAFKQRNKKHKEITLAIEILRNYEKSN
mgnify:FL=1